VRDACCRGGRSTQAGEPAPRWFALRASRVCAEGQGFVWRAWRRCDSAGGGGNWFGGFGDCAGRSSSWLGGSGDCCDGARTLPGRTRVFLRRTIFFPRGCSRRHWRTRFFRNRCRFFRDASCFCASRSRFFLGATRSFCGGIRFFLGRTRLFPGGTRFFLGGCRFSLGGWGHPDAQTIRFEEVEGNRWAGAALKVAPRVGFGSSRHRGQARTRSWGTLAAI
jgi:hypothetical protein